MLVPLDRPDVAALDASPADVAALDGPSSVDRVEPRDTTPATDAGAMIDCQPLTPTSVRAPRVVASGERTPVAATAASVGCGCEVRSVTRGRGDFALEACRCTTDPCVDPSYVVNWDDDQAPTVADPTVDRIRVGSMVTEVVRLPTGFRCVGGGAEIAPDGVTIEADNRSRIVGPRRVWAFVRGTVARCADAPLVRVTASPGSPVILRAEDCNNGDCDGPTAPRPFGVWVLLGTFSPGSYAVFYPPGVSVPFEVR